MDVHICAAKQTHSVITRQVIVSWELMAPVVYRLMSMTGGMGQAIHIEGVLLLKQVVQGGQMARVRWTGDWRIRSSRAVGTG